MKKIYILFTTLFFVFSGFKTDKPSYLLFDKEGKVTKYKNVLKQIEGADIVLFGELHDNPIAHWLQLELSRDLFNLIGDNLVLGGEMFESDNQVLLTEYLDGFISQKSFESEVRLWSNYETDYKPLVEFANKNRLAFIATNVPRRYAALVNKKGFDGLQGLSDKAKTFLPPLPIAYDSTLNCYKSMMEMEEMSKHITANFPKAQAIKDAAMAHFILKNRKPGQQFLHFHGAFHSKNFESIYWYLKQKNRSLNIVTIHTVSQDRVFELEEENIGKADFTICVDSDMTGTF